jgi:hypothetical protein
MFSGPKIVKDTLLFGYDTGENPNSTFDHTNKKRRHFRGEPIDNVVTNTNLDTGWSKGYTTSNLVPDTTVKGPKRISSPVVSFINNSSSSTNSYWYSYGDYAPQVPGQQYTISVYAMTKGKHSFGVRAYTANNSETGRYWGNMQYTQGDGKWRRFTWTFTNASNSQSDSLSFNLSAPVSTTGQRVYLCAPMMNVGNRARPFVVGSRSTTSSLLDLSPNKHTITVNTSFNSDGLPTFDGTDDIMYVNPGTFPSSWSQAFSIEAVIYVPSGVTWYHQGSGTAIIGRGSYAGSWGLFRGGNDNSVYFYIRTGGNTFNPGGYVSRDQYYHIVGTWDGISQAIFYINGEQQSQETNTNVGTTVDNTGNIKIGGNVAFGGNNGLYGAGTYPVMKIYSDKLTASEVKRNFNAYRKRFNL